MSLIQSLITLSLSLLCGYSAAQLSWNLYSLEDIPDPLTTITPKYDDSPLPEKKVNGISLEEVAGLHLFGTEAVKPKEVLRQKEVVAQPKVEFVDTRLNLKLKGIFFSGRDNQAMAIISEGRGSDEMYRQGDMIANVAQVKEIHSDYVLLDNSGSLELLRLREKALDESSTGVSDRGIKSTNLTATQRRGTSQRSVAPKSKRGGLNVSRYSGIRQKLLANPVDAMRMAKVKPVMRRGKMIGYRLNPGSDPELFKELGLQPNDLVTSVNGLRVTDPSSMGGVLNQLTNAASLTVILERHGREETLTINF